MTARRLMRGYTSLLQCKRHILLDASGTCQTYGRARKKNGSWSQVVVAVDGVTVFIMPPTAGAAEEEKEEEDRGKKSL